MDKYSNGNTYFWDQFYENDMVLSKFPYPVAWLWLHSYHPESICLKGLKRYDDR